jgi:hypothetical protein
MLVQHKILEKDDKGSKESPWKVKKVMANDDSSDSDDFAG